MNLRNAFCLCLGAAAAMALSAAASPTAAASPANNAAAPLAARRPAVERIPARGGQILVTPITHGSVQIEHNGKVIHLDPWSQGDYSNAKQADLVLITDIHGDHMDPAALAKIRKAGAPIVAPSAVAAQLPDKTGVVTIANGQRKSVAGVLIEAVPMYNLQRGPAPGQLFHTKGRGNGYVLTLGGRRLYFSGDTENVPELRALRNIDVAFVCMNLPYTMPPREAAALVKAMKPRIVYPYHYRGSNLQEFADALRGERIEVRIRNWYPAAAAPAQPSPGNAAAPSSP